MAACYYKQSALRTSGIEHSRQRAYVGSEYPFGKEPQCCSSAVLSERGMINAPIRPGADTRAGN